MTNEQNNKIQSYINRYEESLERQFNNLQHVSECDYVQALFKLNVDELILSLLRSNPNVFYGDLCLRDFNKIALPLVASFVTGNLSYHKHLCGIAYEMAGSSVWI